MSVHCSLCGKRVSSLASLSGHYRRKHSGRVTARSGATPVGKWLSDAAYVSRLAEMETEKRPSVLAETDAEKPSTAGGWWWSWALLAAVCFLFALSPDSGSSGDADSGLVSSYQPEGDGQ